MSNGFLRRSVLQLVVSVGQIAILGLFIALFPRMAESPIDWAADYFLAMALTTPIFMFFGFELRKRTVSHEGSTIVEFNRQRVFGVAAAVLVSLLVLALISSIGLFSSLYIFLVIILFKVVQAINDQITANYEWHDEFRKSALSGSLRVMVFVPVAVAVSLFAGPNIAILIGSLSFAAVWLLFDARNSIRVLSWVGPSSLDREMWFAGLGAFVISLTINAPRLMVAVLFGETALVVMGVGQSLNRIGQAISGSLVQTLLAVRRHVNSDQVKNQRIVISAQLTIFVLLLLLLPLWEVVFDYASDAIEFSFTITALLVFGLTSQINYLVQSLLLVTKGGAVFAASPVYFLAIFATGSMVLWFCGLLAFYPFLILLVACRLVQIGGNLWQLYRH